MTIHIIHDYRSDASAVVTVEVSDKGKRTRHQIGSIKCLDRPLYRQSDADYDMSATTSRATQELLRIYDAVLCRRYRFYQTKDYQLSVEDKRKIDREIKRLEDAWQDALRQAMVKRVRSAAAQSEIELGKAISGKLKDINK